MNELATLNAYGELIEPATLKIQRLLPGPIERVWSYLTESDKRSQWLASGKMDLRVGTPFELVWRNDQLCGDPGERPEGFPAEHRMQSRITEIDPPYRLAFSWGERGEVSFDLKEVGKEVILTVIHRRISDRPNLLKVSAGWHMHLDTLVARLTGKETEPFWNGWSRLHKEYDGRIPS